VKGLDAKVAIVTGATEGIGLATAERLAGEGCRLVLVARRPRPGAALVARLGPERTAFVAGSVADRTVAERATAEALDRFGALDVLVNNAALDHVGALETTPEREVRELFDVNFFGALNMLQVAGAQMLAGGRGSIVNITSRLASIGVPQMSLYSAAKGALLALTRGAAVEWGPRGIRVNAVAPGPTLTPLIHTWIHAQNDPVVFQRELEGTIPQRRLGTPEEVAATVAFLASDEAAHITGASVAIDGGYTAA
jgi:NAD(P)-dependent dehydrogenase (short-subunit alcohol dehydrogenase family)